MKHFFPITRPYQTPYMASLPTPNDWELFGPIDGRYFMLAIDSGIFIEMSREAAVALSSQDVPAPIQTELQILAQAGAFTPASAYSLEHSPVASLNINVCHNCNITCSYCFAGEGLYGQAVSKISLDTAHAAIDQLLAQLPNNRQATIGLFGGEPLTAKKTVHAIIAYGRRAAAGRVPIKFDIFTNGTLLDESIGRLVANDSNIRILLSLDGPPEINDTHRQGKHGLRVSQAVEKNLKFLDAVPRERIVVRCTLASIPLRIVERARYFVNTLGLTNLVFDPAFCVGTDSIPHAANLYRAIQFELPAIGDFLTENLRQRQKISVNILSEMLSHILMNNRAATSAYAMQCPAGQTYLAVDANGKVFPCHYFVGNEDFVLGNVTTDGLVRRNMVRDNGRRDLAREKVCKGCSLRTLCSGPCPFKQLVLYPHDDSLDVAYCDYMHARIETSLGILASFYPPEHYPYSQEWNQKAQELSHG